MKEDQPFVETPLKDQALRQALRRQPSPPRLASNFAWRTMARIQAEAARRERRRERRLLVLMVVTAVLMAGGVAALCLWQTETTWADITAALSSLRLPRLPRLEADWDAVRFGLPMLCALGLLGAFDLWLRKRLGRRM